MRHLLLLTIGCLAVGLAGCAAPQAPQAPQASQAAAATAPESQPAAAETPAPTAAPASAPSFIDRLMEGPNDVIFLSEEEAAVAGAEGVGEAEAKARVVELYGEEWEGRPQTYEYKGLARNQGDYYYAFAWSERVEAEDGPRDTDLGYLYVSLNGEEVLAGEAEYIYSQGGG